MAQLETWRDELKQERRQCVTHHVCPCQRTRRRREFAVTLRWQGIVRAGAFWSQYRRQYFSWSVSAIFPMGLPVRLDPGAEQFDRLASFTSAEAGLFSGFRIVEVVDAPVAAIEAELLLHSFYEAA